MRQQNGAYPQSHHQHQQQQEGYQQQQRPPYYDHGRDSSVSSGDGDVSGYLSTLDPAAPLARATGPSPFNNVQSNKRNRETEATDDFLKTPPPRSATPLSYLFSLPAPLLSHLSLFASLLSI
jgi:hypothetical protein